MTDTFSLADLRSDHASAEAEVEKLEEQVRVARERRDRLAGMIQGLEEWARERERLAAPKPQVIGPRAIPSAEAVAPPAALHRSPTVAELAVRILEGVGHPLSTRELAEKLVAAGYRTTSHKPLVDAVYGVLTGALKVKGARLVKIGPKWGLRDWQLRQANG